MGVKAGDIITPKLIGGGWEYFGFAEQDAYDSKEILYVDNLDVKTFRAFKFFGWGFTQISGNTFYTYIRTSTNGGSSYDSGSSDYSWVYRTISMETSPTETITGDNADSRIRLGPATGDLVPEGISFELTLHNPSGAYYTNLSWEGFYREAAPTNRYLTGSGTRLSAADVNAIQFGSTGTNSQNDDALILIYGLREIE